MMSVKKFFKTNLKRMLKSPAILRCLGFLVFAYTKFVGETSHWKFEGLDETLDKVKNTNAIWVSWHSRATMMPYFWEKYVKKRMSALVSPHQDGQIIANFLRWFHIYPVSGSTNEKARQGALELMRDLVDGADLFISPDGPRGPRMRMKKSPVYFAQKTGKPIIFVSFSTDKALIIEKAWDKTMIALPFGKGVFLFSEPLYIPENLTDEEFEQYRQKFEDIANEVSIKSDNVAGRIPTLPADVDDFKKKKGEK